MISENEWLKRWEKVKSEHYMTEHRCVPGFQGGLDFLKTHGINYYDYDIFECEEDVPIFGRIIAGTSIINTDRGIGRIGFEIIRDSVEIGHCDEQLEVNKDYRNRGLGKLLTEFAIEYASEVSREYEIDLKTAKAHTDQS